MQLAIGVDEDDVSRRGVCLAVSCLGAWARRTKYAPLGVDSAASGAGDSRLGRPGMVCRSLSDMERAGCGLRLVGVRDGGCDLSEGVVEPVQTSTDVISTDRSDG